jgi:hypothetical protein
LLHNIHYDPKNKENEADADTGHKLSELIELKSNIANGPSAKDEDKCVKKMHAANDHPYIPVCRAFIDAPERLNCLQSCGKKYPKHKE